MDGRSGFNLHHKLVWSSSDDVTPVTKSFDENNQQQVTAFEFSFIPLETAGVCWQYLLWFLARARVSRGRSHRFHGDYMSPVNL